MEAEWKLRRLDREITTRARVRMHSRVSWSLPTVTDHHTTGVYLSRQPVIQSIHIKDNQTASCDIHYPNSFGRSCCTRSRTLTVLWKSKRCMKVHTIMAP